VSSTSLNIIQIILGAWADRKVEPSESKVKQSPIPQGTGEPRRKVGWPCFQLLTMLLSELIWTITLFSWMARVDRTSGSD
jgi:hypothetical protein